MPQLLEWVRFHSPQAERKAASILEAGTERVEAGFETAGSESDPEYWKTVIGVMLQGRIDVVRALLVLHSESRTSPFQNADVCLRIMPIYKVSGIRSSLVSPQIFEYTAFLQACQSDA